MKQIIFLSFCAFALASHQLPPFNCPAIQCSYPPPTSVDRLKFCDIGIVGAMGDSITAAFGADSKTIVTIAKEWRGYSWSVGGNETWQEEVYTLPNFIKVSNSSLQGYSLGTGNENSPNAHLNVAVSGAVASNMYSQAQELVSRFARYPDWKTTWKLVTIFIGGNDLCAVCNDESKNADAYEASLEKALDYLLDFSPRTFVNLVLPIDVTMLGQVGGIACTALHPLECPCAVAVNSNKIEYTKQQSKDMDKVGLDLSKKEKYNTEDFAVVAQPFMENAIIPTNDKGKPDLDYFAPDCFHFSTLGHKEAAIGLWNNMNEKVDEKTTEWDSSADNHFICPTQSSYICTNSNSDVCGQTSTVQI